LPACKDRGQGQNAEDGGVQPDHQQELVQQQLVALDGVIDRRFNGFLQLGRRDGGRYVGWSMVAREYGIVHGAARPGGEPKGIGDDRDQDGNADACQHQADAS
jgi:hypothetical protein